MVPTTLELFRQPAHAIPDTSLRPCSALSTFPRRVAAMDAGPAFLVSLACSGSDALHRDQFCVPRGILSSRCEPTRSGWPGPGLARLPGAILVRWMVVGSAANVKFDGRARREHKGGPGRIRYPQPAALLRSRYRVLSAVPIHVVQVDRSSWRAAEHGGLSRRGPARAG